MTRPYLHDTADQLLDVVEHLWAQGRITGADPDDSRVLFDVLLELAERSRDGELDALRGALASAVALLDDVSHQPLRPELRERVDAELAAARTALRVRFAGYGPVDGPP